MYFEWDEMKRLRTLRERGLDFRDARPLFDGRALYSYRRCAWRGPRRKHRVLEQRLIAVVWTERNGACRIISMRRARDAEERKFRELYG
jgi:uncharacterized protein